MQEHFQTHNPEHAILPDLTSSSLAARYAIWIILLTCLQIALSYQQRFHINPDLVSMLLLAEHYRDGEFSLALSAYWGALPVWMLAVLRACAVPALPASRIIMTFSYILFLFSLKSFLRAGQANSSLPFRHPLPVFFLVGMCFLSRTVFFSPDLLMMAFLFFALARLTSETSTLSRRSAIAAGLCLGLAYLTKGVGLPLSFLFFLSAVSVSAYSALRNYRPLILTVFSFFLLAGPWMLILSQHYGRFMFSSAGTINYGFLQPGYLENAPWEHPAFERVLPPPAGRITSWEDPTEQPGLPQWSPFLNRHTLLYQFRIILASIQQKSVYWVMALLGLLIALSTRLKNTERRFFSLLSLTVTSNLLVYLPFPAVYERYLFPAQVSLLLLLWGLLEVLPFLFSRVSWIKHLRMLLQLSCFLALFLSSSKEYLHAAADPKHYGGASYYWAEGVINAATEIERKQASAPVIGGRPDGLYLAYFLKTPWLGPSLYTPPLGAIAPGSPLLLLGYQGSDASLNDTNDQEFFRTLEATQPPLFQDPMGRFSVFQTRLNKLPPER